MVWLLGDWNKPNPAPHKIIGQIILISAGDAGSRTREIKNNEDDATRLARLNERFKREGKPELKKLDDLPKDYQEPDPYLDETVNIALDLAKLEKARPAEQPAPVK